MATSKGRKPAPETVTAGPEPVAPEPEATTTDAGGTTHRVAIGRDYTGDVTFTRPGVEEQTFTAEAGVISTTKERAAWLLRYTAAQPVAEKE